MVLSYLQYYYLNIFIDENQWKINQTLDKTLM